MAQIVVSALVGARVDRISKAGNPYFFNNCVDVDTMKEFTLFGCEGLKPSKTAVQLVLEAGIKDLSYPALAVSK